VPLADQSRADLLWIRDEFLESDCDFGNLVVHGHTPGPEPVVRPNRVGVDTGAWKSGRLTAAAFEGDELTFLQT
jgi:serine/threonine protein phosphatase 1